MSHVIEINDIEQLASYRLLWTRLLRETSGASFFHTLDWLEIYWRHFGQGQRLRTLIVVSDNRPIGIVPLCVRTERYRVGKLRVLTYPLHDWATFFGPIGPNPTATLLAAMQHIRNTPRDWDLLELRWIDADRTDRGRTPRAMQAAGFGHNCQAWGVSAVLRLDGTWDEYAARQAKKWCGARRREERRLAERGTVTHVRYRPRGAVWGDGDPRWDLWDACQDVAQRSWQARSTSGTTLTHNSIRPFLEEAHAAAARLGMLDLNLLQVDGRPVAFGYNYQFDGNVIGLRMGFTPELAHTGCGNVLQARMIRDSFARGDRHFNLGPGSLHFKRRYCTHLETCYRYTHFSSKNPRVVALRLKRWADVFVQRNERHNGPLDSGPRRAPDQLATSTVACPSRNSFCTAASRARINSGPGA